MNNSVISLIGTSSDATSCQSKVSVELQPPWIFLNIFLEQSSRTTFWTTSLKKIWKILQTKSFIEKNLKTKVFFAYQPCVLTLNFASQWNSPHLELSTWNFSPFGTLHSGPSQCALKREQEKLASDLQRTGDKPGKVWVSPSKVLSENSELFTYANRPIKAR